jgi:hypothetical protein
MADLIYEIFDPVTVVSEMASGADSLVSLDKETIERVTDGDADPKFAVFVIESGWSKSHRLWDVPVFDSVHEQISGAQGSSDPIVGYLGHIRPDDDPYAFPEIQFHWLRSAVKRAGNKARIFTKAYVLPDTQARYYLKKGLAKTVSWAGQAEQIPFQKGVRVSDFTLDSIDLARPRKAGMSARLVGALTSEMSIGGVEVKPEEIAALSANELRAHAPGLVKQIEEDATKPLSDKVSEMEGEAAALKPEAEIAPELRKMLGLAEDADPIEAVTKLLEEAKRVGTGLKERILDQALAKKFKDVKDQSMLSLIRRTLVGEMSDVTLSGDDEKDEKAISEMINDTIDKDSDLKVLVSEMQDAPPRVTNVSNRDNTGEQKELKAGHEDSFVSVRSRR